jgi:hypothetical protein
MAVPRNNNAAAALAILLFLLALTTSATAARPSAACASAFEGCLKCGKRQSDGTTDTCLKCRANSTWDETTAVCRCNSPDFGTLTEEAFNAWRAADADAAPPKEKRYSSVAKKCVDCDKYGGLSSIDGQCQQQPSDAAEADAATAAAVTPAAVVQPTRLTLSNRLKHRFANDYIWNPTWLQVNMGTCTGACNLDPEFLQTRTLKAGKTTSHQGTNVGSADVVAVVTWCGTPPVLGFKCAERDNVRIEAGNPTVGYPWITIGNAKRTFSQGETWSTSVGTRRFTARRNPDRGGAKDMVVEILT